LSISPCEISEQTYHLILQNQLIQLCTLKLKISLKCGAELSEINELVQQFKSMDVMHRVLRYRVENGLEIPKDEESARNLMQKDVRKVLSERELKEMQRERMKLMRKR